MMGWVMRGTRNTITIEFTVEERRKQRKTFVKRSLSNVCHVPMMPDDFVKDLWSGNLGWSTAEGVPIMNE